MKNKGFSLIELITVITILAVIALISTPIVNNVIREIRKSAEESQEKFIIEGAKAWTQKNDKLLSDEVGDVYVLPVQELQDGDYLTKRQLRDLESTNILDNACVKITTQENKYTYEFEKECE